MTLNLSKSYCVAKHGKDCCFKIGGCCCLCKDLYFEYTNWLELCILFSFSVWVRMSCFATSMFYTFTCCCFFSMLTFCKLINFLSTYSPDVILVSCLETPWAFLFIWSGVWLNDFCRRMVLEFYNFNLVGIKARGFVSSLAAGALIYCFGLFLYSCYLV